VNQTRYIISDSRKRRRYALLFSAAGYARRSLILVSTWGSFMTILLKKGSDPSHEANKASQSFLSLGKLNLIPKAKCTCYFTIDTIVA
jgi:hypothetical protein